MWDLPGPGLEPVCPALAGGFLTTAPPGKSPASLSSGGERFQVVYLSAAGAGQRDPPELGTLSFQLTWEPRPHASWAQGTSSHREGDLEILSPLSPPQENCTGFP